MTSESVAVAIRSVVFAALLLASLQFMLWPTITSSFRRSLFKIRQELFLFMASGAVLSTDPAYEELRTTINGLIRFAERITLVRMILGFARHRAEGNRYQHKMVEMLAAHPPEVRKALEGFRENVARVVLHHAVNTSPLGWLLLCAVPIARLFKSGNQVTHSASRAAMHTVEAEAVMMEQCA